MTGSDVSELYSVRRAAVPFFPLIGEKVGITCRKGKSFIGQRYWQAGDAVPAPGSPLPMRGKRPQNQNIYVP